MRRGRTGLALLATAVLAVGVAVAGPVPARAAAASADHAATQAALDDAQRQLGLPGAAVTVVDRYGQWSRHSGTAEVGTRRPIRPTDRVRIASNTKMFTSAVVLQLVAEGRVALDAPIERYLPGLVHGNGYDGRQITVRQLLQHTSGIADYLTVEAQLDPANHTRTHTARELVALALRQPPIFPPGTGWYYSTTGYILAGMIIEAVTGAPAREEITRRVIRRADLTRTVFPEAGERDIAGPHVHGYYDSPDDGLVDLTRFEPSFAGAGAAIVSTGADMARFVGELAAGRIVPPAQLAEMRTGVPVGSSSYGLGLFRISLSCGGYAWGHDGALAGYITQAMATDDGRRAFVVFNGGWPEAPVWPALSRVMDTALCERAG